jgi:hypothetical protein
MLWVKKMLLVLFITFTAIQFVQPVRNSSRQVLPCDISKAVSIPQNVHAILQTACYDCHSNYTTYPWYNYMQPAAWIMANHIEHGKKDLNFSEFGSYPKRRQQSKLKAIADQVRDGEMPLYSYSLIHKNARLTKEEKLVIINWAQNEKDSLDKISL